MPYSFDEAISAFRNNKIRELSQDEDGLRFLKLRSASRREYLQRILMDCELDDHGYSGDRLLQILFESDATEAQIEDSINAIYSGARQERQDNEGELISELYKLEVFDWGGLHQNSLEKTIVDNYVKRIKNYDHLNDCIENEIHSSMRSYVLCSWYNHWTSILIEDVFRDHWAVLPAVGLIKKIDFFINNIPFDLKVTYLPEGFIKEKRRLEGLRPELTKLRQFCRNEDIHFDNNMPDARLLEDLWKKVSDHPFPEANELISNFKEKRLQILSNCMADRTELIKWLYENQGVRRFDASNRLFLILIDQRNFFESWKLKRAKSLLVEKIHSHLDTMINTTGYNVDFSWENDTYTVTSDIIFVSHNV